MKIYAISATLIFGLIFVGENLTKIGSIIALSGVVAVAVLFVVRYRPPAPPVSDEVSALKDRIGRLELATLRPGMVRR